MDGVGAEPERGITLMNRKFAIAKLSETKKRFFDGQSDADLRKMRRIILDTFERVPNQLNKVWESVLADLVYVDSKLGNSTSTKDMTFLRSLKRGAR